MEGKNREETETGKPFDSIVVVVVLLEKERIRDSNSPSSLGFAARQVGILPMQTWKVARMRKKGMQVNPCILYTSVKLYMFFLYMLHVLWLSGKPS